MYIFSLPPSGSRDPLKCIYIYIYIAFSLQMDSCSDVSSRALD